MKQGIYLELTLNEGIDPKLVEGNGVYLADTSRNFKPHIYSQKGFQDAIPLTETITYLNPNVTIEIEK